MRWIDDVTPRVGTLNMAIDEVLLERGGWQDEPLLRTYRWLHRERSIGYFAPLSAQSSVVSEAGAVIVRRLTGGGLVEHGDGVDATFSLVYPRNSRLWSLSGTERYREIHQALAGALRSLGVECQLAQSATAAVEGGAGCACYGRPVEYDVLSITGQKLAGGGQRRRKDGLLHQGSVRAPVDTDSLYCALAEAFGAAPGSELCPSVLEAAHTLARKKYATEKWLRGRQAVCAG